MMTQMKRRWQLRRKWPSHSPSHRYMLIPLAVGPESSFCGLASLHSSIHIADEAQYIFDVVPLILFLSLCLLLLPLQWSSSMEKPRPQASSARRPVEALALSVPEERHCLHRQRRLSLIVRGRTRIECPEPSSLCRPMTKSLILALPAHDLRSSTDRWHCPLFF